MQTIDWYYRRLKVMSPGEIAWLRANENIGKQWYDSLMAKAEQIVENRLIFSI
jgi:hypothetical protein